LTVFAVVVLLLSAQLKALTRVCALPSVDYSQSICLELRETGWTQSGLGCRLYPYMTYLRLQDGLSEYSIGRTTQCVSITTPFSACYVHHVQTHSI